MKKRVLAIILLSALAASMITGCGCEHKWAKATCKEPKTCKLCGETEGEPLGHEWAEATCEKPKTCKRCGKESGEPLGHDWEEATCEKPKTCKRCGATEGEPLEHDWAPATPDTPKTCRICGATEGDPVSIEFLDVSFLNGGTWSFVINDDLCVKEYESPSNVWNYEFFDLSGNYLYGTELDCRMSNGHKGHSFTVTEDCYIMSMGIKNKTSTLSVYDYDHRLILEKEVKSGKLFGGQFPDMDDSNYNGCKMVFNDTTGDPLFYFNVNTGREVSEEEYIIAVENSQDTPAFYSEEKYGYCKKDNVTDLYLVSTPDKSRWGYADSDGNEIAMYMDASGFNESGYALVSSDGRTYDLIDTELNVVGNGIVQGNSAYLASTHGNLFKIDQADGSKIYLMVK